MDSKHRTPAIVMFFSLLASSQKFYDHLHKNLYVLTTTTTMLIGKLSQCIWTQLWIMCIFTNCKFISVPQISWFNKDIRFTRTSVFNQIHICVITTRQILSSILNFKWIYSRIHNSDKCFPVNKVNFQKLYFESIDWVKKIKQLLDLMIFCLKPLIVLFN